MKTYTCRGNQVKSQRECRGKTGRSLCHYSFNSTILILLLYMYNYYTIIHILMYSIEISTWALQ
ncbi:hypothetical protein RchiOBHm_Chr2g0135561 [Rosa chinensis]|uniref:Uncharacterized protein n=1 Tax=Rosa chinensis TaxID=74649 RepID=A0A2P6RW40_ROSCH|nr:hypothetical protein RchiOBHm_Chr2g0135561 [Rosa chinensis]